MSKIRIFGKHPAASYLSWNKRVWERMSRPSFRRARWYADFLHSLARAQGDRKQAFSTLFLRNRPELELIRRLSCRRGEGSTLRISVLGCSAGAEVYSILWTIRRARTDLKIIMHAMDISREILEFAERGIYLLETPEYMDAPVFERLTEEEMQQMFDVSEGQAKIKSWIKEGVEWRLGDVGDPAMLDLLGPQDMVVANNFLCHMEPPEADRCLRNIVRLLNPGGYLFVSGIDLDIRTDVALDLGWEVVPELMEEIHDGDPWLTYHWPWLYAGLEPLDKRRPDWKIRYASCFRVG
jgi:chemotaxis methyl-accepting protein methylase